MGGRKIIVDGVTGGPGVLDLGPLSAARATTSLYDHFQKIQDCERVDDHNPSCLENRSSVSSWLDAH